MIKVMRCRRCNGLLAAEEPFDVDDACSCQTQRGAQAREMALRSAEESMGVGARGAELRDVLSDSGDIW